MYCMFQTSFFLAHVNRDPCLRSVSQRPTGTAVPKVVDAGAAEEREHVGAGLSVRLADQVGARSAVVPQPLLGSLPVQPAVVPSEKIGGTGGSKVICQHGRDFHY